METKPKFRRAYEPTTALAISVQFDDDMMHVSLTDGRVVSVPIIWFPRLHEATPDQRLQALRIRDQLDDAFQLKIL